MQRAIFLDRDGVLNREVDVLRDVKQLRVLPGVADALRAFTKLGYLNIIITNQPVIARGWLTEQGVEHIHQVLIDRLKKKGATINAVYYCPHHPNANLKKYRVKCKCRKPNAGMLKEAAKDCNVNLKKSFMIGDATTDILAGKRAGVKTILVKTGRAGNDGKHQVIPDFIAKDIAGAAKIIERHGK